jgi:hypothetical protein
MIKDKIKDRDAKTECLCAWDDVRGCWNVSKCNLHGHRASEKP